MLSLMAPWVAPERRRIPKKKENMWDVETWDVIRNWNSFAPWLSGIGNLVVIIITLWLVRRDKFIRLLLDTEYVTTSGMEIPAIRLTVTNVGTRKANIAGIYLKTGRFRKTMHIPLPLQIRQAPVLPKSLDDGDFVHLDLGMEAVAIQLKSILKETGWLNGGRTAHGFLRTVRVGIRASTGKTFEAGLNRDGMEQFLRYYRLADQVF